MSDDYELDINAYLSLTPAQHHAIDHAHHRLRAANALQQRTQDDYDAHMRLFMTPIPSNHSALASYNSSDMPWNHPGHVHSHPPIQYPASSQSAVAQNAAVQNVAVQSVAVHNQATQNAAIPYPAIQNHALPHVLAIQNAAAINPVVHHQNIKPKRKPRVVKPKPKPQPRRDGTFPFMELAVEIRIMIYKLLLEENSNPLTLLIKGHTGLEVVRRGFHKKQKKDSSGGRQILVKTVHKPDDKNITHLTPAILRVCKTIHQEAAPFLYGQTLEFEHPIALQKFLFTIGPDNRLLLLHIVLRGWQYDVFPVWLQTLASAFERLLSAQNLKSIQMDRHTYSGSDSDSVATDPKEWDFAADHLSERVEFWAQCLDFAKGKGTARSLLSFSDRVFASEDELDEGDQIFLERKKVFLEKLRFSFK